MAYRLDPFQRIIAFPSFKPAAMSMPFTLATGDLIVASPVPISNGVQIMPYGQCYDVSFHPTLKINSSGVPVKAYCGESTDSPIFNRYPVSLFISLPPNYTSNYRQFEDIDWVPGDPDAVYGATYSAKWSPDGQYLAIHGVRKYTGSTTTRTYHVSVYKFLSGNRLNRIWTENYTSTNTSPGNTIKWKPDSSGFFLRRTNAGTASNFHYYNRNGDNFVRSNLGMYETGDVGQAISYDISPDGTKMVLGTWNRIKIYNSSTGADLGTLNRTVDGANLNVEQVVWAKDDSCIIAAGSMTLQLNTTRSSILVYSTSGTRISNQFVQNSPATTKDTDLILIDPTGKNVIIVSYEWKFPDTYISGPENYRYITWWTKEGTNFKKVVFPNINGRVYYADSSEQLPGPRMVGDIAAPFSTQFGKYLYFDLGGRGPSANLLYNYAEWALGPTNDI